MTKRKLQETDPFDAYKDRPPVVFTGAQMTGMLVLWIVFLLCLIDGAFHIARDVWLFLFY